jgi:hypothetical protein
MLATFAFAVGRSDTAERCPNHAKCWRRCNVQLGFHARRVASPAFTMFCSLTLISVPSMEHGAQEDRAHRARGGGPPDPSPSWFARRGAAAATRAAAPTAAGPHRRVGSRRLSVGLPADASGELSLRVLKDAYRAGEYRSLAPSRLHERAPERSSAPCQGEAGSYNGNSVNKRGATRSRNPVHPADRLALKSLKLPDSCRRVAWTLDA